ncbi:MFS general substrate transporter [Corynespora cassiicola Philippines]|uniref:MFS general substrate transporter n=1 Tax=Corynespora cassiicola Philippines TaxID=1448308 RepID=A0A2T2MZT1_CORCC|nr:MFS general substrate transporter [Corynespora cassiicola Philippines]
MSMMDFLNEIRSYWTAEPFHPKAYPVITRQAGLQKSRLVSNAETGIALQEGFYKLTTQARPRFCIRYRSKMETRLMLLLASLLVFTLLIAVDATSVVLAISGIAQALEGDATASFWIGASYLLAMCVSQPILCALSDVFSRTTILLASTLLLGLGSLVCAETDTMALLIAGRSVQGIGAGGVTVLSYVTFGGLERRCGLKFLTGMSLFLAVGTVCGPLVGAALGSENTWRWIFRLNLPVCLVLGVIIYSVSDQTHESLPKRAKMADLDFFGISLFTASVTSLLAGLSFGGSLYPWTDWRTIAPVGLGGLSLLLFVARELLSNHSLFPGSGFRNHGRPVLDLRAFQGLRAATTFIGATILGLIHSSDKTKMFALLFFLPIYYRVIKSHSQSTTGVLLLPQTLAIAPCAGIVFALVEAAKLSYRWTVLLGWICTTGGTAMLTMLNADRSLSSDILLNILSGIGIGILLPALALSAKEEHADALHAAMLLIFMRYLGSAAGLIVTGILFQHALRQHLAGTAFGPRAGEVTRHAATLMHSIREMASSAEKDVLIQATEESLRVVWISMAALSFLALLLSCCALMLASGSKKASSGSRTVSQQYVTHPPQLELPEDVFKHHSEATLILDDLSSSSSLR